jgi:hypothetical protein
MKAEAIEPLNHDIILSRYYLNGFDINSVKKNYRGFILLMLKHRQVIYDWKATIFWVYKTPISIDRESGLILDEAGQDIREKTDGWFQIFAHVLHEQLSSTHTGIAWPTTAGHAVRMIASGIEVFVSRAEGDSQRYMEEYREGLANYDTSFEAEIICQLH